MEAVIARPNKSTNVRSSQFPTGLTQALIRMTFAAGSRISVGYTALFAQKLFLTPRQPQRNPSLEEKARFEAAERIRIPFEEGHLAAWTWRNTVPGPTIVLVHGWAGAAGQLHAFVRPLLDAGFSVLAYDLPAHGASTTHAGEQTNLVRIARSLKTVVAFLASGHGLPPVTGVISHSLGSASTLLAALDGLAVDKVVVIGSPSRPDNAIREFSEALGVPSIVIAAMKASMERSIGFRWEDLDLPARIGALKQKLLIIHDRDDADVRYDRALELASSAPDAKLLTTSGLGHRRVLRSAEVIAECVKFLELGNPS
jgi:pimeloyl-ACP methyl ester carboxylesterase